MLLLYEILSDTVPSPPRAMHHTIFRQSRKFHWPTSSESGYIGITYLLILSLPDILDTRRSTQNVKKVLDLNVPPIINVAKMETLGNASTIDRNTQLKGGSKLKKPT